MPSVDVNPYLDASVGRIVANQSWTTTHDGDGNYILDTADTTQAASIEGYVASGWDWITRLIFLFNISIPSGNNITAATLYVNSMGSTLYAGAPALNVFCPRPASDSALVATDYNVARWRNQPLCNTAIPWASIANNGWNTWALNTDGISLIPTTGVARLGLRESNYDAPNIEPAVDVQCAVEFWMSEDPTTPPFLRITYAAYTPPSFIPRKYVV